MVVDVVGLRMIHAAVCNRRHIGRRFWFPREVWVVPLVGIVGIAAWGCGWWLVLAHCIGLFSHKVSYGRHT